MFQLVRIVQHALFYHTGHAHYQDM